MDADLSHHVPNLPNPAQIHYRLHKVSSHPLRKQKQTNADIVTGTRYIEGAGVEGWTFYRKLTSRVANFIASTALGTSYTDLTGSFRLYKKYGLEVMEGGAGGDYTSGCE